MEILFLLIGLLLGLIILSIYYRPKLKTFQQLDEETLQKNKEIQNEFIQLNKEYSSLTAKKEEILSNISILQKQAEETSNALYEKSYELANEKMSQAAEAMSHKYQKAEQQAEDEYLSTLEECVASFQKQISNKQSELKNIDNKLKELSEKLNAAVEANKRAEELAEKQDFYKLQLSPEDIEEISKLREVTPYLRNSEPLNKVIYKVYYEKPYTDLIGRVVGQGVHTGIYKITNIQNQKCYIGQAVKIGR